MGKTTEGPENTEWGIGIRVKSVVVGFGQVYYGTCMARPLRIAYPGAVYHVMNRGAARQAIFGDSPDYETFLQPMYRSRRPRPCGMMRSSMPSKNR